MKFDPERHHRRSLRIKNRDYSRDGYYFVTICARNRENIFADFYVGVGLAPTPSKGQPQGLPLHQKIAPTPSKGQPQGLPLHQKIAPTLDFVHDIDKGQPQGLPLHEKNSPPLVLTTIGKIIEINWYKIADKNIKTDVFVIMPNHIHGIIFIKSYALCEGADKGQPQGLPLHKENHPGYTLGDVISRFKSRCVMDYLKYIDKNNLNESAKIWQRNYFERIIRDKAELIAVQKYIAANPANWSEDEENPLNL
jgi:putative transposase